VNPLYSKGVSRIFGALRRGDQRALFAGVAVLVWGFLRRDKKETVLRSATLKPGESLVISSEETFARPKKKR